MNTAVETPGIFRISGSKIQIGQIKDQVNRGINVDISFLDDHVVSGLLKQWFRLLPDPVIPFEFYDEYLNCEQAGKFSPLPQKEKHTQNKPGGSGLFDKILMTFC